MKMISFEVGEYKVVLICDSRNTRNGFAHDATLFINSVMQNKQSVYYLNRTWESWTYQSACLACCSDAIAERELELKDEFKEARGLSRVAGKAKEELAEIIKNDERIKLLMSIRHVLHVKSF